jgi:hypothetical protein
VAVLSAGGVTDDGLKVPVAPVGRPEIVRLTAELKLFMDVMVMVEVPDAPWIIVSEVGEAEMEKSGTAVMVTLSVMVTV